MSLVCIQCLFPWSIEACQGKCSFLKHLPLDCSWSNVEKNVSVSIIWVCRITGITCHILMLLWACAMNIVSRLINMLTDWKDESVIQYVPQIEHKDISSSRGTNRGDVQTMFISHQHHVHLLLHLWFKYLFENRFVHSEIRFGNCLQFTPTCHSKQFSGALMWFLGDWVAVNFSILMM